GFGVQVKTTSACAFRNNCVTRTKASSSANGLIPFLDSRSGMYLREVKKVLPASLSGGADRQISWPSASRRSTSRERKLCRYQSVLAISSMRKSILYVSVNPDELSEHLVSTNVSLSFPDTEAVRCCAIA